MTIARAYRWLDDTTLELTLAGSGTPADGATAEAARAILTTWLPAGAAWD